MAFAFTNLATGKAVKYTNPKPYLPRRDLRGFGFDFFFDQKKVKKAVSKKSREDLTGLGFYTRKAIQNSMKPAKSKAKDQGLRAKRGFRHSKPGEAPRYITGALRSNILFQYDPDNKSLIIGPRLLNGKTVRSSAPVPSVLNAGGTVQQVIYGYKLLRSPGEQSTQRRRVRVVLERKTVRIAPRPYNGPKAKNWPKILAKWRAIVGKNTIRNN